MWSITWEKTVRPLFIHHYGDASIRLLPDEWAGCRQKKLYKSKTHTFPQSIHSIRFIATLEKMRTLVIRDRLFPSRSDQILAGRIAIVVSLSDIKPWFVESFARDSHRVMWCRNWFVFSG
jgi:hypothetical protein